jgi:hypothetical protein
MVYFQTKNLNFGSSWRVLQWKMCVYFWDIWSISQPFCLIYGNLVNFVVIWYIFPRFGMLYQEKSGNPGTFVSSLFVYKMSGGWGPSWLDGQKRSDPLLCYQHYMKPSTGANPTVMSYNASVVKICVAMSSLERFESDNIFF